MFLGAFYISLLSISLGMLNCTESTSETCLACSTFLTGQVCTPYCPSMYSELNSKCSYSGSAPLLFFADFSQIYDPQTENSYYPFTNPNNKNFFDSSQTSPLMTKDRGLFFGNDSYMYTDYNNLEINQIAPNNTVKAWILIEQAGVFLTTFDSNNNIYYDIFVGNQVIETKISICDNVNNCIFYYHSGNTNNIAGWLHLIVQYEFYYTKLVISSKINKEGFIRTEVSNVENALGIGGSNKYYWKLGRSDSFKGFVYMIAAYNDIESSMLAFIDPPVCMSNQFWDGGCFDCSSSCSIWPWCVRGSNCNICFSDQASGCNGYNQGQNTVTGDCNYYGYCIECTVTGYCTKAKFGYFLNIHKNSNSFYAYTSSYLDLWMGYYDAIYYIQSGANENTDYFNNPESDDFIPVSCRGCYFVNGAFGQTRANQILPTNFYIYTWIKGYSGPAISKDPNIIIFADGSLSVILTSYDYTSTSIITIQGILTSNWHYLTFKFIYNDFDTSIIRCADLVCETSLTFAFQVIRDINSPIIIGKSSSDSYNGFLLLVIFSIYQDDFYGVEPNGCLKSECGFGKMPNNDCDDCDSSCSDSCVMHNQCGPCLDNNCQFCYSIWYCNACKAGYNLIYGECLPIFSGCSNNELLIGCTSCPNEMYIIDGTCKYYCPTGYIIENNSCILVNTTVFDINLNNILRLDIIGGFTVGLNSTNIYPDWDINDPVPVKNRGYYFNGLAHMNSSGLVIHHNFYFNSWIKVISYGSLISKYAYIFKMDIFAYFEGFYCEAYNNYQYFGLYAAGDLTKWAFIECASEYTPELMMTKMSIYYNSQLYYNYDYGYVFKDDPRYDFFIGDFSYIKAFREYYDFQGFIWSMSIFNEKRNTLYNFIDIGCNGCSICPSNLICLSECASNTFEPYCEACSECSYGCVSSASCSLCNDPNCLKCSSFSNCDQCSPGYALYNNNSECIGCHLTCEECTNYTYSGCLTCSSGYLYYNDLSRCLPSFLCPTNYAQDPLSQACIPGSDLKIFSLSFGTLQGEFNDSISQILVQSGETNAYYPDYEPSDVIATKDRGVYFTQSSFMSLQTPSQPNLVFGHTFTISLWILVNFDGNIFTRACLNEVYFAISANNGIVVTSKTLNSIQAIYFTIPLIYDSWHIIQITKEILDEGEKITLYLDLNSEFITYNSYYEDPINSILTVFGDSQLSFQGFLWSVDISNTISLLGYSQNSDSFYPLNLNVSIPTCHINTFYVSSNFSCEKCLTNCSSCTNAYQCSLCPDTLCAYCPDYSSCVSCKNNSELINNQCVCNLGFSYIKSKELCESITCFTGCSTCTGNGIFECFSCEDGFVFLNDICEKLPTGYANISNDYKPEKSMSFELKFDGLQGILYDSVSKVPVLTGNSQEFYPDFDGEDPVPAYLRGYYFDGDGSIMRMPIFENYTKNPLILPPSWGVDLWFMPVQSGPLLFSSSSNTTLFTLSINTTCITLHLFLADLGNITANSSEIISYDKWNNIYIFLNYTNPGNSLSFYINKVLDKTVSLSSGIFVNVFPNTSISIGGIQYNSYYKGFIYYLAFYIIDELRYLNRYLSQNSNCLVWEDGTCLPECPLTDYWIGPEYNQCQKCSDFCLIGCRNELSCNLCDDPLCKYCKDYSKGNCNQCSGLAASTANSCTCQEPSKLDLIKYLCVICKDNEYFNEQTCVKCPDRCGQCDANQCFNCVENARFIEQNCLCLLGYNGTETCSKSILNVEPKLTFSNNIILIFDYPLSAISIDSIKLISCVSLTFSLEPWSPGQYYIPITYKDAIPEKCPLNITLNIQSIVSIYNGILETGLYNFTLHSKPITQEAVKAQTISAAKKTSESTTTASTAASASVSMMNPNPACLWSFINTIQMICFIDLTSIELTPKFAGQLKGLKKYNMFPNIFEYFVNEDGNKKPFKKAYDFGYKTNLLLLNSGNYLSAFLFMISVLLISLVLKRFTHIKPFSISFIKMKIENTVKNYKYGAFLRFWITCYMEVFAAALIAVMMFDFSSGGSIANFSISIIIIVISI